VRHLILTSVDDLTAALAACDLSAPFIPTFLEESGLTEVADPAALECQDLAEFLCNMGFKELKATATARRLRTYAASPRACSPISIVGLEATLVRLEVTPPAPTSAPVTTGATTPLCPDPATTAAIAVPSSPGLASDGQRETEPRTPRSAGSAAVPASGGGDTVAPRRDAANDESTAGKRYAKHKKMRKAIIAIVRLVGRRLREGPPITARPRTPHSGAPTAASADDTAGASAGSGAVSAPAGSDPIVRVAPWEGNPAGGDAVAPQEGGPPISARPHTPHSGAPTAASADNTAGASAGSAAVSASGGGDAVAPRRDAANDESAAGKRYAKHKKMRKAIIAIVRLVGRRLREGPPITARPRTPHSGAPTAASADDTAGASAGSGAVSAPAGSDPIVRVAPWEGNPAGGDAVAPQEGGPPISARPHTPHSGAPTAASADNTAGASAGSAAVSASGGGDAVAPRRDAANDESAAGKRYAKHKKMRKAIIAIVRLVGRRLREGPPITARPRASHSGAPTAASADDTAGASAGSGAVSAPAGSDPIVRVAPLEGNPAGGDAVAPQEGGPPINARPHTPHSGAPTAASADDTAGASAGSAAVCASGGGDAVTPRRGAAGDECAAGERYAKHKKMRKAIIAIVRLAGLRSSAGMSGGEPRLRDPRAFTCGMSEKNMEFFAAA
jgi:uncharacterized protein YfiM (DUF2279 family)